MIEPITILPLTTHTNIGITLQPPLSNRGHGPGLILIVPEEYHKYEFMNKSLDPEPLQKWAEEGYAVLQITVNARASSLPLEEALDALNSLDKCDTQDGFGLISEFP
jgi:carboxymethylenebutenolidase